MPTRPVKNSFQQFHAERLFSAQAFGKQETVAFREVREFDALADVEGSCARVAD